jgi:hypothetical protein
MEQVTKEDVLALLRAENTKTPEHDMVIYADYFMSYRAAVANIAEHGDIVLHPRTGQPFENPYCAVRDKAAAALRKITLQVGCLWDNPQVWFASVQTGRKAVATATFHRVLARSAQEAAESAALDYELPITVWVKSEAQEQAIAIEVAE